MTRPLDLPAVGRPPSTLSETVDWFDSLSYGLVRLEPYPLVEVRAAIAHFELAMARHIGDPVGIDTPRGEGSEADRLLRVVASDHRWFATSFEQLWGLLRIVEGEDHGGHRQALGQYGRLVSEAVRRHLADERALLALRSAGEKG